MQEQFHARLSSDSEDVYGSIIWTTGTGMTMYDGAAVF